MEWICSNDCPDSFNEEIFFSKVASIWKPDITTYDKQEVLAMLWQVLLAPLPAIAAAADAAILAAGENLP